MVEHSYRCDSCGQLVEPDEQANEAAWGLEWAKLAPRFLFFCCKGCEPDMSYTGEEFENEEG